MDSHSLLKGDYSELIVSLNGALARISENPIIIYEAVKGSG